MRFTKQSVLLLVLTMSLLMGLVSLTTAQDAATPEPVMPTPGLAASPTPIPRPLPISTVTEERATVEFYFSSLAQGQTGLVHVFGTGMAGARARFLNNLIDFFPADDGYYGFISPSMEQNARSYDLDLFVWYDDGTRQTVNTSVAVDVGGFIKQDVTLPPEKSYLVDPEIERDELARLESIFSTVTLDQGWDASGFQLPIPGAELTSPFGAFRTFNGTLATRHTGWDLRATLGQPVMASASGTVAYTGFMQIRGNIVVIDHGYGVFSTYCHFSQVHVTRGQSVTEGQVLGVVGNTGRTSGPHFHWEIAVNGSFVDADQFILMWKPV